MQHDWVSSEPSQVVASLVLEFRIDREFLGVSDVRLGFRDVGFGAYKVD